MENVFDYKTNNYKDKRTKLGNFFYSFIYKASHFLMKHLWLYYLLNYTWGIIMTLVGWVVVFFSTVILNKNVSKWGPSHYIVLGNNWGGLELGTCFIVSDGMGDSWTLHTKCHEMGHSFQNAILGPFMIFLVSIPSATRYWVQIINRKLKHPERNKDYDCFWAEESATDVGTRYYEEFAKK